MSVRRTIEYQPALDGVRALAVGAVLLFHAGVPGFDGGYLGVSVFFTLSGYLITSLLLTEHEASGTIDLRVFYGRRLRRLLPASAVTIIGVMILAGISDVFDGVSALRAQVLGAVFQVANWVLLAGDGSYQDLLADTSGTPSPLEHFWSLAIEEQFYWVWPACMLLIATRTTSRARLVRVVGILTAIFCIAAPVIAQVWGPDAAYWATPARLGEILVGAWLATASAGRTVDRRYAPLAPAALVALAAAVVLFPTVGGPAYEGALPLVAVTSAALIFGLQADGHVRDALSWRPLVGLGLMSYGVYLYHWPIFVVLDADRVGFAGAPLVVVRLAVTMAVSFASYRLLEQPIRRTRRREFGPTLLWSGVATVSIAVAAVVVVPASLGDYWRIDDDVAQAAAIEVVDVPLTAAPVSTVAVVPAEPVQAIGNGDVPDSTTPGAPSTTTGAPSAPETTATTTAPTPTTVATIPPLPELARPMRVLVTGDSTAAAVGTGVVSWAAAHPDLAEAEVVAAPGCGFVMGGERAHGDTTVSNESCDGWVQAQLLPAVERTRPDLVVVMVTSWDIIGHRWDDGPLLTPMDPEFRSRIESAYAALVDDVTAAGAGRLAFVRHPIPDSWWLGNVDDDEIARHEVMYETYEDLADQAPDRVAVIGLERWFTEQGLDDDEAVRPDGVHLDPDVAADVLERYLGEQIVRAALGMETQ
jgi:peptidoglycan/LPS O-acetylase OafA/YrhL